MFDHAQGTRQKIAVIGAGISGLSAAYYLTPHHDVTLIEAAPRLGGHARTVLAGKRGDQPVDTGFIVFNYVTYPYLTRLFNELDVPVTKSEMSFGASIDDGALEYGLNTISAITAQRRNLLRPRYYKMIADILKFGRNAESTATSDDMTISELVHELRLSDWFRNKYLMPMCGAIWSTPVDSIDQFPAKSLVQFFRNHALLAGMGEHQWWTVKGGSIEYVRRIETALRARGCDIRMGSPVDNVTRSKDGVTVAIQGQGAETYDQVIFACHSDQALKILGTGATMDEERALGAIRYQPNKAVLHCDTSQMPKRRKAWSSWSYRSQKGDIGVTYWMNRLQNIPDDDPMFVTLNPSTPITSDAIYDEVEFDHPIFDKAALRAQLAIRKMQGQNRTWFAGAYNRHGFHEDGIASAIRIVRALTDTLHIERTDHAPYDQSLETRVPVNMHAPA
ncbi:Predicted NAD/FAD-binding protein [Aliiroseovarius halocynthiae]|uniref:FAD-dependent oxidoreductase n=1 Tax=Aliiroseovarius halocynthiae TaxID=985055 RepID=A0A545SWB6_9RHOB|nr:FAD-dependent oxidoreductase [Aliiroseovarius halocynthiae]TQV69244.1 FAD-dependent oxidoreductase [Aliiroseovarius halocynthiae]SMR72013.1 Predicted NAD/FAD-binding protein [Aliiroseovarius halocynthiae]